ncbi:Mitochondral 37S ribosomal protein S27 [Dipodascopsis uninucleata]
MALYNSPSLKRLFKLYESSCKIFDTVWNPENVRTGNKILRRKLKGPAVIKYYPATPSVKLKDITKEFPMFYFRDMDREPVNMMNEVRRRRGKGPPRKKDAGAAPAKKRR